MQTKELVELLRFCGDEETICGNCKRFDYRCGDWKCAAELLTMAADALDARNAGDALLPAWMPVKWCLPPMHTVVIEDEEGPIEYQVSETVLAYTADGQIVAVKVSVERGKTWWFNEDGADYEVTHWMPVKPPRDMDLYKLELSVRALNCLRRGRIFTIERLRQMSDEDLRRIRNMGSKTIAEIREKLDAYLQRVYAGEAEPPARGAEAQLVDYRNGAEAMRAAILFELRAMARRTKGTQGAAIADACKVVEKLEVL